MDSVLALTIIFIVIGLGDYVANKTKAIFSSMFVASLVFLGAFWLGLTPTIFKDSTLLATAPALIGFLIVSMGTLISMKELIRQWKTVTIALGAIVGIAGLIMLIGTPIIGKLHALAAAPPLAGGIVATIIVSEAAKAKGLTDLILFASLLFIIQNFVGLPIASWCLKREGQRFLGLFRKDKKAYTAASEMAATTDVKDDKKPAYQIFPTMSKDMQTTAIFLAKVGMITLLSIYLSKLTNGAVHQLVVCLIMGIVFKELGFLEENILQKSNSFGLIMMVILIMVFNGLAKATPADIVALLWPILVALFLAVVGLVLVAIPIGKLLGYSWEMSVAIGTTCFFGFPGTFIISNEVAQAVTEDEMERKAVLNQILPKMLIAGFTTVTIASVILAGFMVNWL